jgi:hypothetical protein
MIEETTKEKEANHKEDKEILNGFVSTILKDTKPMDSDFSKFVDDNFFDLV